MPTDHRSSTNGRRRSVLSPSNVRFFETPAVLRTWFLGHHTTAGELWVGYYRRATGKPSVTWQESVDEALSAGWIDGIRKPVDAERYTIRFTPRRKGSIWSRVNIRRVETLTADGRMLPAGIKAFDARLESRSGIYSYEQPASEPLLDEQLERMFKRSKRAWSFFQSQPPGHRKLVVRWIMSAKRDETRRMRLKKATEASAAKRRLF
ncbi:MAG: YdeI/OmpD-associated family protein [Vicinamibacterales bacterium]